MKKYITDKKSSLFTILRDKDGNSYEVETLAGKSRRYADELSTGYHYDEKNDFSSKLTKSQRSYRLGYLKARSQSAKAYKADNPGYRKQDHTKMKISERQFTARASVWRDLYDQINGVKLVLKNLEGKGDAEAEKSYRKRLKSLERDFNKADKLLRANDISDSPDVWTKKEIDSRKKLFDLKDKDR